MTDLSNSPAPWIEVSAGGGALIVAMLFVMWAQQPPPGCTRLPETARRLELSLDTDREHLSNDLASADRIVRRYAAATSHADDQQTLLLECRDTLLQQIASAHGVPLGQLRDSVE
jgi:hypothetical protein